MAECCAYFRTKQTPILRHGAHTIFNDAGRTARDSDDFGPVTTASSQWSGRPLRAPADRLLGSAGGLLVMP